MEANGYLPPGEVIFVPSKRIEWDIQTQDGDVDAAGLGNRNTQEVASITAVLEIFTSKIF